MKYSQTLSRLGLDNETTLASYTVVELTTMLSEWKGGHAIAFAKHFGSHRVEYGHICRDVGGVLRSMIDLWKEAFGGSDKK